MKLFASGCSFTWGGGLFTHVHDYEGNLFDETNTSLINLQRLSITWPGQLHKIGSFSEFHNHSMGCGSNNRIIRKTIDFFIDKINKKEDLSDWIAVIQWSEPSRFEFFDILSNSWGLVKSEIVFTETRRRLSKEEEKMILSQFFWNHEKAWQEKMFNEILMLGDFFEKHDIKYFFVSMNKVELDETKKNYCKNFVWYNNNIDECITNMSDIETCISSPHPSERGHQLLAEKFLNFLVRKYDVLYHRS
jgi:hypothetical protein